MPDEKERKTLKPTCRYMRTGKNEERREEARGKKSKTSMGKKKTSLTLKCRRGGEGKKYAFKRRRRPKTGVTAEGN